MNDNYLIHYGVLGMKWGIRRYQNKDGTLTDAGKRKQKRRETLDKAFTNNIKNGKDKPNISTAEKVTKNTSSIISDSKNIVNSVERLSSSRKPKVDLSHMTDAELKQAINRMNLERQYNSFTSSQTSKGMTYTKETLEIIGSAVGIAGSAIGIAAAIKSLKG